MKWLNKLERKYGRLGIPNLMIYITATMLVVFAMTILMLLPVTQWIEFDPALIMKGQVWRLITFIFILPSNSILWIIISLYFYYFIGTSLEDAWGAFRFTVYYLVGIIGAIIAGFISGGIDNTYLNMSLFFAFAQLFPDYQVLLFFFIPIKVKYLAYMNWAFFAFSFLENSNVTRLSILFALLNYFLFFGPDIWKRIRENIKYSKRRRQFRREMNQDNNMWGR